jgi:hypothetical protein
MSIRLGLILAALAWAALAIDVFWWMNRAAHSPKRTVTVLAATDLRNPREYVSVSHTYTTLPTTKEMAAVFVRISRDHGFTMEAAEAACEQLFDAIAAQQAETLDAELAGALS